jgi:hypothetical protein
MKVIFHSRDFASVEGLGFGFTNRRPMAIAWEYQGRVKHTRWQGLFECHWEDAAGNARPTELLWTVQGDARLFGLAAALKSAGFLVAVEQD